LIFVGIAEILPIETRLGPTGRNELILDGPVAPHLASVARLAHRLLGDEAFLALTKT
jgi:hypothetical protein